MNQNTSLKRLFLCVAILTLYGVSFILPVEYGTRTVGGSPIFGFGGKDEPYTVYGWELFVTSFELFQIGVVFWLANPALMIGVVFLVGGRWKAASICGIVGLVLGLSGISLLTLFSGRRSHVGQGVYLWLGSFALLAAVGFFRPSSEKSSNESPTGVDV